MSFTNDFSDANRDFSLFRDELLSHIKGALVDIETKDTELAKLFDQYSGIDAVQIVNRQLRAVAIRVQWGKAWDTFTIRYKRKNGSKTEYQKRAEAILNDRGYFYPYLTIQAYLNKRGDATSLLSCGVVKTKDLYQYMFSNMPSIRSEVCPEGNTFLHIKFSELQRNNANILIFGDKISKKVA